MKIQLFVIISFVLFSSCKRDPPQICTIPYEMADGPSAPIDMSVLKNIPAVYDTLLKYPKLQVWKVVNDQYEVGFKSNVSYKGIGVDVSYYLYQSKTDHQILCIGSLGPDSISSPVTASILLDAALKIAKDNVSKSFSCPGYRLVIINTSADPALPANYRLVWQILIGDNMVTLDANNGNVYSVISMLEN